MVFAKFFTGLSKEEVLSYYGLERQDVYTHPFRRFVYETCMKYVRPDERENKMYRNLIRNFATAETERWIELCDVFNKTEIFRYFIPIIIEKRLEEESIFIFGTIDRGDIGIFPVKEKKIVIIDYKSGNIPKGVLAGPDPGKLFGWKLPPSMMKELHFYATMYLLKSGWKMSDEIIEFLNDERWWFTHKDNLSYLESKKFKSDYIQKLNTRKNNRFKMFKGARILKQGDVIVSVYYLGGKKPYKVIKEFNYKSYKAVLMHINDLRSREFHQMYVTHPRFIFDEKVCKDYKRCSRVEHCRKLIEADRKK